MTWRFTTPEWSYDLRNARYISCQLPQVLVGESENTHSTAYEILDSGELRKVEDSYTLWDMGFVMTDDEARNLAGW